MKAQAIKLDQGWFIKNLPGFADINSDVINLEVELAEGEYQTLDYKELRGITVLERYFGKREREVHQDSPVSDVQGKFREYFELTGMKLSDFIKGY